MTRNKRTVLRLVLPLLILGLISIQLRAQGVKRIELPLPGNTAYQAVPLGKQGVLLISKPDKGTFNVQKFDTNLERVWSMWVKVDATLKADIVEILKLEVAANKSFAGMARYFIREVWQIPGV